MNKTKLAVMGTAFTLSAGTALAGGMSRTNQSVLSVLQDGDFIQANASYVSPSVTGTIYGAETENMSEAYPLLGLTTKFDLGSNFGLAIIYDQPFGADVKYPDNLDPVLGGALPNPSNGAEAHVKVDAVTVVGNIKVNPMVDIFAGPRIILAEGEYSNPSIPQFGGQKYEFKPGSSTGAGIVAGAAFSQDDIGLRLAVTYSSATDLDFTSKEFLNNNQVKKNRLEVTIPQSVNVDFQTGLNPQTLLLAGMRWVNWQEFELKPPAYDAAVGDAIVDYYEDTLAYYFGGGYKVNDQWSIVGRFEIEEKMDGDFSPLGPTDGKSSIGGAVNYNAGLFEVTGGFTYAILGDDKGDHPALNTSSDFSGNSAVGFGVGVKRMF